MLELPALTTRIVSGMAQAPIGCFAIWLWRSSAATAQEAMRVLHMIGPRGEDDRHPRAEHDAGGVGMREEGQVLGQHVAGLEIRHHQDLRLTGDRRLDALDACRLRADRIVEGERTVELAAGDLTAIRHLAQRRSLDGGGNGRGHGLDGGQNGDLWRP